MPWRKPTRAGGPESPAAAEEAPVAKPGETAVFHREGEYWTVALGSAVARLKHGKGLAYIFSLLEHPGAEFHVLDLVAQAARLYPSEVRAIGASGALPEDEEELAGAGIHLGSLGDAGEMLDEQARHAYRHRLTELHERFEEARQFNHLEQAAEIEREIDALTAELSRAVGLGGRSRRSASAAERARQSVTHAIRTTVERIGDNLPALGASLSRTIKTGIYCSYQPEPDGAISWDLEAARATPADSHKGTDDSQPEAAIPALAVIVPPVTQILSNQAGFVGRDAEGLRLRNLVDSALAGHGAVAMIGGGPGVGKTRLAMEIAAYAASKGFRSFIGHCYERDEPYPYLPFAEIFETMLARWEWDEFRAGLGDNAAEVAQIAPRMRRIFPDLPPPTELPPQQARRYLFQSLTEYLARLTAAAPLLLVLDDLHWTDESTLALLNFLAHRVEPIRLVVIGTYRDGDLDIQPALARTLEELLRIGVRPFALRGLSRDAVARMLRGLAQREVPESLVGLIFKETDGNPFFVEEVYKHLVEEGKVFDEAGNFRTDFQIEDIDVPGNVRLVLGRRLDRLSPASRGILSAAAVIGPGFTFELLLAMAGAHDADEVLAGIDEAQRMGLVVAPSNEPAAPFAFVHELVRQTLLSAISAPRRQRLHLGAADAIEVLYPHESRVRAAEIAHHLVAAGPSADRQKVARYLALAGKNALAAAAYEEARRHVGAALGLRDAREPGPRAELLLDMATADRGLGNWDEAFALWQQAVDVFSAAGDSAATGCVFFEMFEGLLWSGRGREAYDLAQRGLDGLKEDPANAAYLAAMMGLINSLNGRYEPARQSFGEALSMARALADRTLVARIQAYWSICNFYFMQLRDALENGRKSAELAAAVGSPGSRAIALSRVQVALHHLGRIEEAAAVGAELEPLARKLGHFPALSFCIWTQAWMEFGKDADFARLTKRLTEDLEVNRTAKVPLLLASVLAQFSVIEFLRGDRAGALDYADEAMRLSPFQVMLGFGAGAKFRQLAYAGDRAGAMALLDQSRAKLPRSGATNTIGSWAMLLPAVEGLFVLGERGAAAEFYPLLRELIGTGTVCMGWIARFPQTIAGVAAAAARNWSGAEEHFDVALRQAQELPNRLEVAEISRFHAMMLMERRKPRDLDHARRLLERALESYERFGMPRHAEMTRALAAGH